ncbi:MAG TPA: type III polyketide synthase [Ktedonobacterales bacterium]|nr:type III polyketide synthase [Ktedonobacterales bacterium]
MSQYPRILGIAAAHPPFHYQQEETLATVQAYLLGPGWREKPELAARGQALARDFAAAQVERRQCAINVSEFYQGRRSTGERMALYREVACELGETALRSALTNCDPVRAADDITDLFVVSCTGYTAPGLDVLLARDVGLPRDIRRTNIGHMGCFGAMVGLRQGLATARAYPGATVAMLSVEICSLHLMPSENPEVLTSFSLFGDAAAALVIGHDSQATGPEIVGVHCAADFSAADQMSWTITDEGFVMSLSPRVPVTLRRNIRGVMDGLLTPHGLRPDDISHWLVHPGGPSILTVIQRQLELSDDQMALSWQVLRDHGNCSSATVLLILEALLQSGRPRRGEWGVMMAFGPGLTLETCLLRF